MGTDDCTILFAIETALTMLACILRKTTTTHFNYQQLIKADELMMLSYSTRCVFVFTSFVNKLELVTSISFQLRHHWQSLIHVVIDKLILDKWLELIPFIIVPYIIRGSEVNFSPMRFEGNSIFLKFVP